MNIPLDISLNIFSEYQFYGTYVKLLKDDRMRRKTIIDDELDTYLSDINFKSFIIDKLGKTYETVKILSGNIVSGMLRPQRLIMDHDDFYIACDMMTNTYYICYRYLMMIDIDMFKLDTPDVDILKIFENDKSHQWMIYKSRSGYHAFLISERVPYGTRLSVETMLKYPCDFYYVIYSYLRGYSVRLNPKKDEKGDVYEYLGTYGNVESCDTHLTNLVNFHIDMSKVFNNEGYSLMK